MKTVINFNSEDDGDYELYYLEETLNSFERLHDYIDYYKVKYNNITWRNKSGTDKLFCGSFEDIQTGIFDYIKDTFLKNYSKITFEITKKEIFILHSDHDGTSSFVFTPHTLVKINYISQ